MKKIKLIRRRRVWREQPEQGRNLMWFEKL